MNEVAIQHAALPVSITGEVVSLGNWKILKAAPTSIKPIE